jgi:hypothetical protein
MKTLSQVALLPVLTGLLLFLTVCKKDTTESDPTVTPPVTSGDYNGKVNVDKADATIGIANVIDVKIPQGAFSGDATFTIRKLDPATLPVNTDFKPYESFEITSSGGSTFAKNLEIKFKYAENKSGKKDKTTVAWYSESAGKWMPFYDVSLDTIQKTATINTNHLCKLSRCSYFNSYYGFTDWTSSLHFNIYWTDPGVMTNALYNSPNKAINLGPYPWYVQDILYYLEEAWRAYKAVDFALPNGKIDVFLQKMTEPGETSWYGHISINQTMTGGMYFKTEEFLPTTCAHELLHYVQDYYYFELLDFPHWWMEATAVQADRLVWPGHAKFEALDTDYSLALGLLKSWDNCATNPEWYIAGRFLSYLANYRSGAKMNIPDIIKETGKATNVSYYRTIVDTYVKSKLGSTGIGDEFRNFAKWVYDAKGDIKYPGDDPGANKKVVNPLSTTVPAQSGSVTVPQLAVGFIECQNQADMKRTIYAKLNKKSAEVEVMAYYNTYDGTRTYVQSMNENDSVKFVLQNKLGWIDIMVVNKTKDTDNGTATVTFRLETVPTVNLTIVPDQSQGLPNKAVQFSANTTSTVAKGAIYQWFFGDGDSTHPLLVTDLNTASHTYAAAGDYNVVIMLYDSNNAKIGEATMVYKVVAGNTFSLTSSQGTGSTSWPWKRVKTSFTMTGSIEGLGSNTVKSITTGQDPQFAKQSLFVKFAADAGFKINYTVSYTTTPASMDSTYVDANYFGKTVRHVWTLLDKKEMRWEYDQTSQSGLVQAGANTQQINYNVGLFRVKCYSYYKHDVFDDKGVLLGSTPEAILDNNSGPGVWVSKQ